MTTVAAVVIAKGRVEWTDRDPAIAWTDATQRVLVVRPCDSRATYLVTSDLCDADTSIAQCEIDQVGELTLLGTAPILWSCPTQVK